MYLLLLIEFNMVYHGIWKGIVHHHDWLTRKKIGHGPYKPLHHFCWLCIIYHMQSASVLKFNFFSGFVRSNLEKFFVAMELPRNWIKFLNQRTFICIQFEIGNYEYFTLRYITNMSLCKIMHYACYIFTCVNIICQKERHLRCYICYYLFHTSIKIF